MKLALLEGDTNSILYNINEIEAIYTGKIKKQESPTNNTSYSIIFNFKSGNFVRVSFMSEELRDAKYKEIIQNWKGKEIWKL